MTESELRERIADAMAAGMVDFWATPATERPPRSQRNELLAAADAVIAAGLTTPEGDDEHEARVESLLRRLCDAGCEVTIWPNVPGAKEWRVLVRDRDRPSGPVYGESLSELLANAARVLDVPEAGEPK